MKILVINEPFVKDFCRTQRWAARTRGRVLRAPDWLAYATAVLERDIPEAKTKLFDFPAMGWYKPEFEKLIKSEKPDFVILDSTTPSIDSDIDCARIVKDNSTAKVIMAGPHASALPEETLLRSNGSVDVICIGEYDYTVRDVIKGFNSLESVPGIAFIKDARPFKTVQRELIADLDQLPFPAWRHLDLKKYFDGGKLYPYIDIISGRGCPNQCIFCLWPQVMHGQEYRLRSAKSVVDEIERDIKLLPSILKTGEFFFEDDTFTVNQGRAIAICEEILRRGLKLSFSVNGRADSASDEMFSIMKRAGCREILVGFESGDQQILDNIQKRITLEQSRTFVDTARRAGLEVHGCFVIGLPGETPSSAKQTIDFAMKLGLSTIQYSGAVPFPGTAFFDSCEREGWLKSKKWSDWLNHGEQSPVVEYPHITGSEIEYFVDLGLKKFYLRPSYMINFLLKARSASDIYRKFRGAVNYFQYILTKRTNASKT